MAKLSASIYGGTRDNPGAIYNFTIEWPHGPAPSTSQVVLEAFQQNKPIYENGILHMDWLVTGGPYTKQERQELGYKYWGEPGYDSNTERDLRVAMINRFGKRSAIEHTEPTLDRFSPEDAGKLAAAFADLYFELCSSYKYNNDDPTADPAERYDDQLHFTPKALNKRYHTVFYALGGSK